MTRVLRHPLRDFTAADLTPEGPYEARYGDSASVSPNRDAGDFLELFEHLQRESVRLFDLSGGQREMRMIIHLVRSHLAARLVTTSSLAAGSGLSYGTAIRTIARMCGRGLIVRRVRTATGKSVSLHPSADLLARWNEFATRAHSLVRTALTPPAARPRSPATPRSSRDKASVTLPPPPVLSTKLSLSRGLRILVHADPTFTAMRTLKKQLEMILGTPIRGRALSIDRRSEEHTSELQSPC